MFAIVVDVVTNEIKEDVLQEILYADDIVLIVESMTELQEKFYGLINGNWINGRCSKIKRVANRLAIDFRCRKCKECHKNVVDQEE